VPPRLDFFTKEIRRLLHGGKMAVRKHSQSPVLPWAWLAYDACLNAGSTARLADDRRKGTSAKRNCPFSSSKYGRVLSHCAWLLAQK
jgi:hypothetical protein